MELKQQSDYEQYIRQDSLGEYYVVLNQYTFYSVYQPIFDKHRNIIGMEALLRIRGVDGANIRPDLFFADASIDTYFRLCIEFLSRAIHIRNFAKHFAGSTIKLFLNVMPQTLLTLTKDMGFKDNGLLYKRLEELGMHPSDVVFEVVEESCGDTELLIQAVQLMRANGFLFAIDDFGSHHSNMSRVKHLCPDIIKIDRSYLLDYCSGDTLAIANAVELAEEMNAKVVIEGVEENIQLSAMQRLDLDYYQGFYLGKPNAIHHWTNQVNSNKLLH
ncbi:EAL domain-containing protein [Vibrio sp. MMG022]|uniref:EAL domain-containing protein n=1 Tax=Vibrio sp. MMG023 TaxID=2909979 RepID=UPI001F2A3713|nr:EAL domain-containing protein [Vibrio sp. MMG023]MCF6450216.1 EAL domain-containing protein [Vibrio sp. MMG023]